MMKITTAAIAAAFAILGLSACGKGGVIGSGPGPTPTPVVPSVSHEFTVPTASSQPLGITSGTDGFLYVAEFATNKIAKMSTGGSFTEYQLAAGTKPYALAPSSSLNSVWFTENGGNNIGSIDTSGNITEYAIPTANAGATYITQGSAGTFWFSETTANKIASIDGAGNINEFAVPTANAGPSGIIVSPSDGGVWFVEKNVSAIARFDPIAKTFRGPYFTPTAASAPLQIISCPDVGSTGALCFNETNAAKLGRILPNGTISEVSIAPATSISALALGGDYNIYFIDSAQNKFGQMNGTTLAVTEFPIPTTGSSPQFITLGPDLRMYFTETSANKVGQISYF